MEQSVFTIVIRGNNQYNMDKNITCSREWTVEQLKKKIECVYPGNPKMSKQRLIYGGKLLVNDHQIKHILKDNNEVVHLAYHIEKDEKEKVPVQEKATTPSNGTELRHRNVNNVTETAETPTVTPYVQQNWPYAHTNAAWQYQDPSQAYAQWLLQYQHHYAAYAQYYGHPGHTGVTYPAADPTNIAENGPRDENPAPPNPDMRLDAQGRMAVADDENEDRDWLDAAFALTRFGFLLSIIYFYSSTYRFIITVGVFIMIYLYQAGAFQVNRRVRPQPAEPNNQQQTDDNNNQSDGTVTDENSADENHPAPIIPPPPSVLVTAWHFVRSFFSSLLPTGPPGMVN